MSTGAPVFGGLLVIGIAAAMFAATTPAIPQPGDMEPIAYVGHGAFFAKDGRQIAPTTDFVVKAQAWYRTRLLASASVKQRADLASAEARIAEAGITGQTRLVLRQNALQTLADDLAVADEKSPVGRLRALNTMLMWQLQPAGSREAATPRKPFVIDPAILRKFEPQQRRMTRFAVTANRGQLYVDECRTAGVPIPPPIGRLAAPGVAGWTIRGEIPPASQFIFQAARDGSSIPSVAEVRTYEDAAGFCIALPRYQGVVTGAGVNVLADGVICLSRTTSKVCFWDNQMAGAAFAFTAGTVIPIGAADPAINAAGLYQAGGEELEGAVGGVCTDCHAGENPFVIHPDVMLSTGIRMGSLVPINFAPNRYEPIVKAGWPQNRLSHNLAYVPASCSGCHQRGGSGGRLPHLSSDLVSYCPTILRQAVLGSMPRPPGVAPTMPQGAPGSAVGMALDDFLAQCAIAPAAGASNRGDPHLTTTNGVAYDFQAAGEFTALRNTDTGFEVQTRQTPVQTSFIPGTNPYTGLAGCVALNTAVAVRVGKHRITYQPGKSANMEGLALRIDGKLVDPGSRDIDLGRGRLTIVAAPRGNGFDIALDDGTRLIVTPEFWASEGHWYLNIEVVNTPAREGTMGLITASNWLPMHPDGTATGARPASLAARHAQLNGRFAEAWRVTPATSLFDYAAGTSTATFTDRNWPPRPGTACTVRSTVPAIPVANRPPLKGTSLAAAKKICARIEDSAAKRACIFDATVMGDPGVGAAYQRTLARRIAAM